MFLVVSLCLLSQNHIYEREWIYLAPRTCCVSESTVPSLSSNPSAAKAESWISVLSGDSSSSGVLPVWGHYRHHSNVTHQGSTVHRLHWRDTVQPTQRLIQPQSEFLLQSLCGAALVYVHGCVCVSVQANLTSLYKHIHQVEMNRTNDRDVMRSSGGAAVNNRFCVPVVCFYAAVKRSQPEILIN